MSGLVFLVNIMSMNRSSKRDLTFVLIVHISSYIDRYEYIYIYIHVVVTKIYSEFYQPNSGYPYWCYAAANRSGSLPRFFPGKQPTGFSARETDCQS